MASQSLRLVFVSALALFLELLLIRYLAVEIRFFMFFKNFVLMAAFLGLGLGTFLAKRNSLMAWFHPLAVGLMCISVFAGELGVNKAFLPTGENATLWYTSASAESAWELVKVFATCLGLTGLVAATFVPLGQQIGKLLQGLPSSSAYAWDLGGSIIGSAGYAATALLDVSPRVGLGLVLLAALPLVDRRWALAVGGALTLALSGLMATVHTKPDVPVTAIPAGTRAPEYWWSPYHRVHWMAYPAQPVNGQALSPGYVGFLNGNYYFDLLDFRMAQAKPPPMLNRGSSHVRIDLALQHYSAPYAFVPRPQEVLLLGAGPGNDAAVAMMQGAGHVTAVEIDPAVVRMGHELHPMKPYDDPRVSVVVDDARAFMARTKAQYDLVSFGHLDSINLISSFSSVRADTYVYTRESMQNAWALVKPGGLLSVSFGAKSWLIAKLYWLLAEITGQKPMAFVDGYMSTLTLLIRKPGGAAGVDDAAIYVKMLGELEGKPITELPEVDESTLPTDDWPFLFLREPALSPYHSVALLLLLLLAAACVRLVTRGESALTQEGFAWGPFWLGVGFMLIETKSLTELGLLFGSTWIVAAIGVIGVLAMNLLAVWLVKRKKLPLGLLFGGLLATIALNLALPLHVLLPLPPALRVVASVLLLYSPLFFAGAAFAQSFADAATPAAVFSANLIGALVGGTMEYLSVVVGFRALWLLGAAVYLLALYSELKLRGRTEASTPATS